MKRIFLLASFLACAGFSSGQSPRMTVRNPDGSVKLLQVEQAEVSVRILGEVAETVFDLRFRNDADGSVEGEFVLPLPPGATVSGYALEVNGKMRDGVAVEKERARIAYETVKRRMIDPGLVEREANNTYRTKVFPIPAKSTKRLRISYREILKPSGYALPLEFPALLSSFSCQLTGEGIHVTDAAGLSFAPDPTGRLKAELKSAKPAGTLKVTVAAPDGPRMFLENEARPAFFLSDRMPEIAPRPRPAPATVMLVWDASASRSNIDRAREFSMLDGWFAKLGKTRVKLRLLRAGLEDGGEFEVRNGGWSKLKQALQQVDYDGATALSQMQVSAGDADLALYVGDGLATLGSKPPAVGVPLIYVHSGTSVPAKALAALASSSGGAVIDLATDDKAQAVLKLTQEPLRLISVTGTDLEAALIDPGRMLRVFGSLREARPGKLELRYGFGNEVATTREVTYQPGGDASGTVRQLHAQRVLAELEQQSPPDRKRIIAHCKKHGLVSDFTSLIVLERIEDYAEHQIPPPEPELQEEYRKLVDHFAQRRSEDLGGLAYAWGEKLQWYGRRFPGYEVMLLPRLRQVGIWKKAVESLFQPEQRDAEAYATVAGWFEKATKLIENKAELRTKDDYRAWCQSIDNLNALGPKLAQTPSHAPPAGKDLAVSVQGLVANPGLVTGASGMTLRQAIDKAGLHPMGKLDYVALYRNSGKVVYNTLSERYQDAPLFPGDMVVVSQAPRSMHYSDPFADPFAESSPPADPKNEAPIREQTDLSIPNPAKAAAGGVGFGGGDPVPVRAGEIVLRDIADDEALPADLVSFEKSIAAGTDPESAYRKLKGTKIYQPRFYVDAARILFAKQQAGLARRVLSNLVELRPGDVSALRSHAFWLAELGQVNEAEAVLSGIPCDGRTKLLVNRDLASLRSQRGDSGSAFSGWSESLKDDVTDAGAGELAAIAVTEFNALLRRPEHADSASPLIGSGGRYDRNLPADVRIVATSADENEPLCLIVTEPGGFQADPFSPCGGRVSGSSGVAEYMIRHAVPGNYQISCISSRPTTVRLAIHTGWGRADQKTKVLTRWLDGGMAQPLGEVEFGFQPREK